MVVYSRGTTDYLEGHRDNKAVSCVYYHCVLLLTDEDDLQDVRSAVADLARRWKDLGISLGIRLSELNAIFPANSHSPSNCLRETLALWLKQNYNVRTTPMLLWCTCMHHCKNYLVVLTTEWLPWLQTAEETVVMYS